MTESPATALQQVVQDGKIGERGGLTTRGLDTLLLFSGVELLSFEMMFGPGIGSAASRHSLLHHVVDSRSQLLSAKAQIVLSF